MNKKIFLIVIILSFIGIVLFSITRPSEPDIKVQSVFVYPDVKPNEASKYFEGKPVDLVFFFQGIQTDILAPYSLGGLDIQNQSKVYGRDKVFFTINFNNILHWSSPRAVSESIKVMKDVVRVFNTRSIKIIGISKGGSLVLNILSSADQNLKEKITDAIIVYPVIDYNYTLFHTKRKNIREQLIKHFFLCKNPFQLMKDSSPVTFYKSISKNTNIVLIEGLKDTHVCSNQIEKYYELIKPINKNTKLIKWGVDHLLGEVANDYRDLVLSILK